MEDNLEYFILQKEYRDKFKNEKDIFPNEWYNVSEYDLKKKILSECLEKSILIVESSYYYDFRMKALNT